MIRNYDQLDYITLCINIIILCIIYILKQVITSKKISIKTIISVCILTLYTKPVLQIVLLDEVLIKNVEININNILIYLICIF